MSAPRIVVIGGGTGSFTLLGALKNHTKRLTALVNMVDDGGSTGQLRDEFGVLPPGDVRQCLVALSESSDELREVFNYRYPQGTSWEGHSFGNLFLSTLEMMTNDFDEAVSIASKVLNIRGKVVPITLSDCTLVMELNGRTEKGESNIISLDFDGRHDQPTLRLDPEAELNPHAKRAIEKADLIVIAPGNLYGSLAPALLVKGIKEALLQAKAPVVYVCNLVNKPHQTKDFAVHDYVEELERIVAPGFIDVVLYNTDEPSPSLLKKYALDGEFPIRIDKQVLARATYQALPGHFLTHDPPARNENDTRIHRSLIRHDAEAVSGALMKLIPKGDI